MRFVGLVLHAAICGTLASHQHGLLMPNPTDLGYQPIPLNTSYRNVTLPVIGSIPAYLNGTFYRGAPGQWPDGWWLDGLITLNGFKFHQGGVKYTMNYNKDEAYNRSVQSATSPELSEVLLASGAAGRMPHPPNSSWPTGVAFHQVQGHLVGSTGVSSVNEFDADTLEPVEMPFEYDDELGAPHLAPTHTVSLPDGEVLHHIVRGPQDGTTQGYTVTSIAPGSRTRSTIAKIDSPKASSWKGKASYMHMTSATSEFYIMIEAPCYYPEKAGPVGSVDWVDWEWNYLEGSHVRLVNKTSGESQIWPLSENVVSIHHINAYKDPITNSIVLDVIHNLPWFLPCSIAFKSLTLNNTLADPLKYARGLQGSVPKRLTIPLEHPGKKITPIQIGDGSVKGLEFPTIRYQDRIGQPYTYLYGTAFKNLSSCYYDALVKMNVNTGSHIIWHVPGTFVNEPTFVPDPEGVAEDAGVIVTNVLDWFKNQSFLLVLNATTMLEIARAGPTPHVIPHGFHGKYYNQAVN